MANISYGVNLLPKTNNAYTLGNSDYKWSNIYGVSLKLSGDGHTQGDLYVGCASDYTGGTKVVKETDYATTSKAGLVRIQGNGLYMDGDQLLINKAMDDNIRLANHGYSPIVPTKQHLAVFYGLATAAGDTTQKNSNNTVGAYTNDAKVAIQKMLGIYQAPWELIRADTITHATEANEDIEVDDNGNTFELTDIALWIIVQASDETGSSYGDYGRVRYFYGTGASEYDDTISGNATVNAGATSRVFYSYIEQNGNMLFKSSTNQTTASNNGGLINYATNNFWSQIAPITLLDAPRYYFKVRLKNITGTVKYKLYGKRRWT